MLKQIKFVDVLIFLTIALTGAAILIAPYRIDHDAAWYMHSARTMLSNRGWYLTLIEASFLEVTIYLSAIPYLLSRVIPVDVTIVFNFFILSIAIYGEIGRAHV